MKIGIVGLGKQGRIRLDTVARWQRPHQVTHVCDVTAPSDLPGIRYSSDYRDILNDSSLDVVFVCTPNHMTRDVVVGALERGKHVFSEKPPGRSSAEASEMLAAATARPNLKLMFGFNHRHHDSVIRAKDIVDSGELGEVLWMRGRYGKSVSPEFLGTWRANRELAGGGILLDQGIHMLDLFLYFVPDLDQVKAFVSNLFWKMDIEDNVFALLRNSRGQVASLHSTMTQWRHLFSFEVFLTKGHVVINGLLTSSGSYGKEELSVARNRFYTGPAVAWEPEEKTAYEINTSWDNEMRLFMDCVESGRPVPIGNGQDAVSLMTLIDRIYAEGRDPQ